MSILDSILKTIESIKKMYPSFKIKVASVKLGNLKEDQDEKLVELLSTNNVAQLNVYKVSDNIIIKGVP